ncbi:hypothetical protein [Natrarchaeobius oligotrophus]|uniref:Uncharacterized protein n=1 Tax=Natrarchaeobius chitinivorans TaxID=1679083 RepID=A0A3N6MZE5_NATCH|nr:hypothetical protein [Natrarchaeobius chitinivorans]RQH03531.1 hypothetical protein EA472_00920 [Natrarchaeobius chitinivorans]
MTASRRAVLERAGITTVAVATAGRLTIDAGTTSDDEPPEFSRWLSPEDVVEFTFVDWASVEEDVRGELEQAQADEEIDVPPEYENDPMVAPASDGVLSTYLFVGLDLVEFGLGRLLDDEAFESTVDGLLRTGRAFVATGEIDPDEIDERLTGEPEFEFVVQMERTDEIGEYDVYTPIDDREAAIAVGTDALLVVDEGDDPRAVLESIVDVAEGDTERATDDSEPFAWLLETAGHGDVVVGQYGGPFDAEDLVHPALDPLAGAAGFVSSLTLEDEMTSSGTFASVLDDPDEAALEDLLGVSADERAIDVDGDRVTATGTWREVN